MRVLVGLAALTALAVAPLAADAATLSYSKFFPGDAENAQGFAKTDWDGSVTLPQFNAALGTLTSVDLLLYGEISSSGSLTNRTQGIIDIDTYSATMQIAVAAPGLADPLTVGPPQFDFSNQSLAPGQSLTFGQQTPVASNDTASTTVSTGFDPYVGTGNLEFPVSANTDTTIAVTGGDLDFVQNTGARARLTITYTYDLVATEVPEPASALLLGAGLLGLGLLRRRS